MELSDIFVHLALFLVQLGMAGYQIITRVALVGGMSPFVFAVYRGIIGLCVVSPFAIFLERKKRRPLTWRLIGHFFVLGLTGVSLAQAFYLEGLTYTSPTFAAAIQNSIPAITFIIAVAFGQERVHFRRHDGQAKVVGTVLCIVGATLMVFYKGPALIQMTQRSVPMNVIDVKLTVSNTLGNVKSWQLGAFYHLGMCIAFSAWLVIQIPVVKQYPTRLSVTSFMSLFGTLQLLAIAVFKETNPSKWILPWGPALLSVLYAGLIISGVVFALQMWCVQKGGAVLVAVYQPVQTIIVAILTFLFLREDFYLGSLVGGLLIIAGLYLVSWGQREERRIASVPTISRSTEARMDCKSGITASLLDRNLAADSDNLHV
eukprot:c26166_g9_i1 orf=633-1751(-)